MKTPANIKETARKMYEQINFDLKKQVIKVDGLSLTRIKLPEHAASDYWLGKYEIPYLASTFKWMDYEERIDELARQIEIILKQEREDKGKVSYGFYELETLVREKLDKLNVDYKYIKAISSFSSYFKTERGVVRVSDHLGIHRTYEDVILYFFSDEKYEGGYIENTLNQLFGNSK